MSSVPVKGLFRCYSPECCQLWLAPPLPGGTALGTNVVLYQALKQIKVKTMYGVRMVTIYQICWSETLVAICNSCEQLQWSTRLLANSPRVGEALVLKENHGAAFVLRCDAFSTRGTWSKYLSKLGLVYSIGMVCFTVGLFWVSLEINQIHVLISLLSNQVVYKSGVLGWLGEQGERLPCFPSGSISVGKRYVYLVTKSS